MKLRTLKDLNLSHGLTFLDAQASLAPPHSQSVSHPLLDFHSVSDFERLDDIVVADIEVDDKKERRKKWPTWSWTWTGG